MKSQWVILQFVEIKHNMQIVSKKDIAGPDAVVGDSSKTLS